MHTRLRGDSRGDADPAAASRPGSGPTGRRLMTLAAAVVLAVGIGVALGWERTPAVSRPGPGPVERPGTVAWRVVAADVRGNQAAAPGPPVTVVPCAAPGP